MDDGGLEVLAGVYCSRGRCAGLWGAAPEQDVSEQDVNERTAGLMELHTVLRAGSCSGAAPPSM